jgi:membrane-bound metal-dependent hydrolase YbcI (DUF457 family)
MLGRSHSLSGACAFAATASAAHLVDVHPGWPAIGAGLLATAGAALLPDIDHESATIAWTFGPVSKAAARFVNRISGGHRHATHSLAFAAASGLATWAAVAVGQAYVALPLLYILFAFAIRALHLAPGTSNAVAFVATIVAAYVLHGDYGWLPWSVTVGVLAHLAGDCLTKEGCPLLWPKPTRCTLGVIRRTGNAVERWIFAPMFIAGTVALLALGH